MAEPSPLFRFFEDLVAYDDAALRPLPQRVPQPGSLPVPQKPVVYEDKAIPPPSKKVQRRRRPKIFRFTPKKTPVRRPRRPSLSIYDFFDGFREADDSEAREAFLALRNNGSALFSAEEWGTVFSENAPAEVDVQFSSLSLRDPTDTLEKVDVQRAVAPSFVCVKCGHVFSVKKTLSMHTKVCR